MRSVFYYGGTIDSSNRYISFDEGGPELNGTLNLGDYTLTELLNEVARAMNVVSSNNYELTMNRTTRIVTISGDSVFTLKVVNGSTIDSSVYGLIGFSVNRGGGTYYTSGTACGFEYSPQFFLQGYVPTADNKEALEGKTSVSGSGVVQVATFGDVQYMECNIVYITNQFQASGSAIENNSTGLEDARTFMDNLITKAKVEFMEDRDNRGVYEDLMIESTPANKKGIGYKIKQLLSAKLYGYYQTGNLKFRKI